MLRQYIKIYTLIASLKMRLLADSNTICSASQIVTVRLIHARTIVSNCP